MEVSILAAWDLLNGTPLSFIPKSTNGFPYITVPDDQGYHAVPSGLYAKKETSPGSGVYIWTPVSISDPMPSRAVDRYTEDITFQDAADAPGNGNPYTIGGKSTISFTIYGTATSRTVVFEVQTHNSEWIEWTCFNPTLNILATNTIGTGTEAWTVDNLTGFVAFRARIAAVSGGDVSIKGRAVA